MSHGMEHLGKPGQGKTQNRDAHDSVQPTLAGTHGMEPALSWVHCRMTRQGGLLKEEGDRKERMGAQKGREGCKAGNMTQEDGRRPTCLFWI